MDVGKSSDKSGGKSSSKSKDNKSDDASESDEVYEVNFYYGIHYPKDEIEHVCAALRGTKFNAIAGDDREMTIGEHEYLRNVNSDFEDTRGIILANDMSKQGPESESPATFCKFDPTELTDCEEKYKECVDTLTDMYDTIVAYYKKNGRGLKNLYLGWMVYNCEWCGDEESSSEEVVVKKKQVPKSTKPPQKSGKGKAIPPPKAGKK